MEILVKIKNVYGNEMIYPVCEKALNFAKLTSTKTLAKRDIEVIKQLGFKVLVQQVTL